MANSGKIGLLIVIAITLIVATALIAPVQAGSLRNGGTAIGSSVIGAKPGEVMWTYYDTTDSTPPGGCTTNSIVAGCDPGGNGDNILHLVNPNGISSVALGGTNADVCAMIYVFDDDQEMGECCGCPLSASDFERFSVAQDLTANFIIGGNPSTNTIGAIAVVATAPNVEYVASNSPLTNGHFCPSTQSGACNAGCDPTELPGYAVSPDNNLLGAMIHNTAILDHAGANLARGLTEIPLSDDAAGDLTNLTYLQNECGVLVGGGSGAGVCQCPKIPPPPILVP
jgi:hypothetical protein